jgi:hypothetical protein
MISIPLIDLVFTNEFDLRRVAIARQCQDDWNERHRNLGLVGDDPMTDATIDVEVQQLEDNLVKASLPKL